MKGHRWWAVGCGLLLALPLAGRAEAQERREGPPPQRAQLEDQVRRAFARAVRERVGLSEDQMRRLAPLTRMHEQRRRTLQQDERRARMALQAELRGTAPDTLVVGRLLDTLVNVHRRRFQMIEAEHRELAAVMTPVQRARYLALQEQVRRRMEQMRQRPGPR